jgi:hypothetical protein
MNVIMKEYYLKLSTRADYNNYMMRLTNLNPLQDPIDIAHGVVTYTAEIRNGNYHLKPSANLIFDHLKTKSD